MPHSRLTCLPGERDVALWFITRYGLLSSAPEVPFLATSSDQENLVVIAEVHGAESPQVSGAAGAYYENATHEHTRSLRARYLPAACPRTARLSVVRGKRTRFRVRAHTTS